MREEAVLHDEKTGILCTESSAKLADLDNVHTAVVDDEAIIARVDALEDFLQNCDFFDSHFVTLLLLGIHGKDAGHSRAHG